MNSQHKGDKIYTGSGHHCGVIPYSSVWCGGLPLGLDDEQYKAEQPREGLLLAGATNCWEEFSRSIYWFLGEDLDASTLGVSSPIYRQRPWASSQILSEKGANNWPF